MLTLNDGRSELWQWDTGRTLAVDADCSQVHFSNKVFGRSLDVDVIDGVAAIPDILLQTDKELTAWAFVGTAENGYTKISKVFKVNKRNKPSDYVFTPTDQTTLGEILERLDDIESAQDPDAIKNAVEDYLDNNPIRIEETDPTVPAWAKQLTKPQYTAEEVGALPNTYTPPAAPVQSVNGKTGAVNLTAEDVGALPANTEIPLPGITEETDPTVQGWAKTAIPAAVGQYFRVSAVDENGNVTAVEAVDAPSGGGASDEVWELLADVQITEAVTEITVDTDLSGKPFEMKKVYIYCKSVLDASSSNYGGYSVGVKSSTLESHEYYGTGLNGATIKAEGVYSWVLLEHIGGIEWNIEASNSDGSDIGKSSINRNSYMSKYEVWQAKPDGNIRGVQLVTNNASVVFWGEGSYFKIYGVRA